ncbi:MAG: hypothetical protein LBU17_07485 [Treponema sp.]|nr:hypothetical protein [Treponema sp.]
MKKHGIFFGFAVLFLAAIFTMTGCPTDDDGGDDGGNNGGLDLPAITEETTGQAKIEVNGATLVGENALAGKEATITIGEQTIPSYGGSEGYGTWWVNEGKFSLILNTPSDPYTEGISNWLDAESHFFGSIEAGYEVTVSDKSAKIVTPYFSGSSGSIRYSVDRMKYETDETTYYNESTIQYVYVSKNVTLSREQKTITDEDEDEDEGQSYTYNDTYSAFTLPLKAGWNLVQTDENMTLTSSSTINTTIAIKIADKDVPWTIEYNN